LGEAEIKPPSGMGWDEIETGSGGRLRNTCTSSSKQVSTSNYYGGMDMFILTEDLKHRERERERERLGSQVARD
jgi:hypothetical protein